MFHLHLQIGVINRGRTVSSKSGIEQNTFCKRGNIFTQIFFHAWPVHRKNTQMWFQNSTIYIFTKAYVYIVTVKLLYHHYHHKLSLFVSFFMCVS